MDFEGWQNTVVLGLARGGVPIAAAVAKVIGTVFDAIVVRKLGVPGQEKLTFGAMSAHGPHHADVRLDRVVASVASTILTPEAVAEIQERELGELRRRQQSYLRGRAAGVHDKTVILCDDALASGASMMAAIKVIRQSDPVRVIVAAPVGTAEVCAEVARYADEVICPLQPDEFGTVEDFYSGYGPMTDEDVLRILGG